MNCTESVPATIFLDGQELAKGEVILREFPEHSVFWPQQSIHQDSFPDQRVSLILWGKPDEIQLVRFERCDGSTLGHYHFERVKP